MATDCLTPALTVQLANTATTAAAFLMTIAGMVVWMMAEGSGLIFDRDRVLLLAGVWLLLVWGQVLTGMLLAGGCV
jgi:hypothetical protein